MPKKKAKVAAIERGMEKEAKDAIRFIYNKVKLRVLCGAI